MASGMAFMNFPKQQHKKETGHGNKLKRFSGLFVNHILAKSCRDSSVGRASD